MGFGGGRATLADGGAVDASDAPFPPPPSSARPPVSSPLAATDASSAPFSPTAPSRHAVALESGAHGGREAPPPTGSGPPEAATSEGPPRTSPGKEDGGEERAGDTERPPVSSPSFSRSARASKVLCRKWTCRPAPPATGLTTVGLPLPVVVRSPLGSPPPFPRGERPFRRTLAGPVAAAAAAAAAEATGSCAGVRVGTLGPEAAASAEAPPPKPDQRGGVPEVRPAG